jgi:argininosuccinate lyase
MMGRLAEGPHPTLFELLYEPHEARAHRDVLPYLLAIDAAHVVMLEEQKLVTTAVAGALLALNQEMTDRVEGGEAVIPFVPQHRGIYFLYERELVARLGAGVGGAPHLGRSRNDINAAVTRLRLRGELLGVIAHACDMVEALLGAADAHASTTMSGFTHLQPAQPTTLGHYLAGVGGEILRSIEQLEAAYALINLSPMGAAAGYGTAVAIAPARVAELLGFEAVIDNSLDAVASRDYLVPVLATAATLSITLSRLSTDLQAWSSVAYGFIDWPDSLVSTSSIMPQKRNAFVCEHIRGRSSHVVGALTATLVAMKSVPFTNSIEVSAEATSHVWPALAAVNTSCALAAVLLRHVRVSTETASTFAARTDIGMTAVADLLVEKAGLTFRSAHDVVSRVVASGANGRLVAQFTAALNAELAQLPGTARAIDEHVIASALDPAMAARAATHGGGPGPSSLSAQLTRLAQRLDGARLRVNQREEDLLAADARRRAVAAQVVEACRRDQPAYGHERVP